jgi:hypothetical protein
MRSLRPEQLLLLLLFVLVPLFNLLVRWLQRRAREQRRPRLAEPPMAEPVVREGRPSAAMPPRARVIAPALPQATPRKETRRRPPAAPQPVRRRAAPLGGRAAVRRAIIAMNILGPCRGLEEPPPGQPEGSLQQGARRR